MGAVTKESTTATRSTVGECILGQMEAGTRGRGSTESVTGREGTIWQVIDTGRECGIWTGESNGPLAIWTT